MRRAARRVVSIREQIEAFSQTDQAFVRAVLRDDRFARVSAPSVEVAALLCRSKLASAALKLCSFDEAAGDGAREMLAAAAKRERLLSFGAEAFAGTPLKALRAAEVEFVVVKGPAVARFHASPALRTFSDVDLLVAPSEFFRARSVLEAAGLFNDGDKQQLRSWFDRQCREGINLNGRNGGSIDLHHHVPPWIFGEGLSFGEVLASSEEARVAGAEVLCAAAGPSLLIASLHVLSDVYVREPSLASWRDVHVLVRHLGMDEASQVFSDHGLSWLLGELGSACPVGPDALPEPDCSPEPGQRQRRLRLRLLGWTDEPSVFARQRYSWIARLPLPNGLLFLVASLVPSDSYLKGRFSSLWTYWRSGFKHWRAVRAGEDFVNL